MRSEALNAWAHSRLRPLAQSRLVASELTERLVQMAQIVWVSVIEIGTPTRTTKHSAILRQRSPHMSDCLHCDIHELLDSQLEGKEANLAEIAAKVTEVLADIILMAPPDEQSTIMADILANLGSFLLEKKEDADPTNPRRSSH